MSTRHLASLGAREIPRSEFTALLARLTVLPAPAWNRQIGHDLAA
jgi:Leu/Phe-tRNA-protein transferase